MTSQEKLEFCLRLYNDIINGYSVFHDNGEEVFIKHLKDSDYAFFEDKKSYLKKEQQRKVFIQKKNFMKFYKKQETGQEKTRSLTKDYLLKLKI